MEISVSNSSAEPWILPFLPSELARALQLMSGFISPAEGCALPEAIELSILDDAEMASLNGGFLGLAGPTNVLSFPAAGAGGVGSLALAAQTVCREAWLYGQEPSFYALRMLAHGLAHIMGYEHGELMDEQVEPAAQKAAAIFTRNGSM